MVFLQKPAECFLFYSNYKRKWSKIHFFVILYSTSSSSHSGRYLNLQAYWIQKPNLNFIIIKIKLIHYQNNQFSSVAQSCMILWNPMDCNTPGLPVHHQLLELPQSHVHWVSDATQPSHPLLPPSPPAVNLAQHQNLFQCISSLHQVAKVLELQHQHFQWIFRVDFF